MSNIISPEAGGTVHLKQARAVRTREVILAASARHFDTYGYEDTTVDSIQNAGNLSKGAIYFHFSSKEAIAQQLTADWIKAVNEVISATLGNHSTPAERITAIFADLARRVTEDANMRAGMKLILEPTVNSASGFAHWVDAISDIVDSAIRTGEIPDIPIAHRLAWNLCACMIGTANASAVLREDVDLATRIGDTVSAHVTAATEISGRRSDASAGHV